MLRITLEKIPLLMLVVFRSWSIDMLVSSTGISVMKADEDIGLAAKFIVTTNSIVPLERLEISRMVLFDGSRFFHSKFGLRGQK